MNPNWIATIARLPYEGQKVFVPSKKTGNTLKVTYLKNKWWLDDEPGKILPYLPAMWKERGTTFFD